MRWTEFKAAYFITLLLFLVLGVGARLHFTQGAAQQLAPYVGSRLLVQGAVEPASVRRHDGLTTAVVRCEQVLLAEADADLRRIAYQDRLRVSVQGALPASGRVELLGTLEELRGFQNPGSFDTELYNKIQALGGCLEQAKLLAVQPGCSWWQQLQLWNVALSLKLEKAAGKELGGILSGMALGGSSRLEEETRALFTNNGIAHLLSVSGTHLLLLTGLLMALLRFVPAPWRQLVVLLLLSGYAALCGLRPPVLRALLMCAVLLTGGKCAERGRLLCLVAVVLLLYKPLWLWDIGFQLSFAAAAGLVWLLPACKRLVSTRLPQPVAEALAVTLAAQLAVLPLEVVHFHQLSVIPLASNILLVPLLELATQLALVGVLFNSAAFITAASFILQQVLVQGRWLAELSYSTIVVGELPAFCWLLYYAALALAADFSWLQLLHNRERYLALGLCCLVLAGTLGWQKWRTLPLTVYFLDVGQGDCAVVVTPERRVIVVDTGGLRSLPVGSRIIAPFLRSLGYSRIDMLLISHYDFDHAGGAAALLQQLRVSRLLLPAEELTQVNRPLYEELLQQAKKARVQAVEVAHTGMLYQLDAGTQLEVLAAPQGQLSGNEASTLAAVRTARGSVLFTGDMGIEREAELTLGAYTVLKAGHHGSRYSTSSEFLAQVRPQLTVVSCGRGNRYGHPHAETLARLRQAQSAVVRTDETGCVKIVFDERGIKWYSYVYNKKAF